eukprot:3262802-Pyramimonas_sp.AAC.1
MDAVTSVPCGRWTLDTSVTAKMSTPAARFGSLMDGIEEFDPQSFGVATVEGTFMDPQQRMLMQVCRSVLQEQQLTIEPSTSAVMVGISGNEYMHITKEVHTYSATGGTLSVASGRLAFTFGLQGPCM